MLLKKDDIVRLVESLEPPPDLLDVYTRAAILVVFVNRKHSTNVVYIRRTNILRHHSGDIAFPGGKVETTDLSSFKAAARETFEEIGVSETQYRYAGCLGNYQTLTSRFNVTAHLVWSDSRLEYDRNDLEVAEIIEVPLSIIYRQFNPKLDLTDRSQLNKLSFTIPGGQGRNYILWGLSARITFHFCSGISKLKLMR